jgi:hypothetical protein
MSSSTSITIATWELFRGGKKDNGLFSLIFTLRHYELVTAFRRRYRVQAGASETWTLPAMYKYPLTKEIPSGFEIRDFLVGYSTGRTSRCTLDIFLPGDKQFPNIPHMAGLLTRINGITGEGWWKHS